MDVSAQQCQQADQQVIRIKILGLKAQQRYIVRRVVQSALAALQKEYPHFRVTVDEVSDWETIQRYTAVMIAPALVINDELVYDQWIPTREQVEGWLRERLDKAGAG